jgi:hypothetical protein
MNDLFTVLLIVIVIVIALLLSTRARTQMSGSSENSENTENVENSENTLEREYARWLVVDGLAKYLNKQTRKYNYQYELMNIFERFLIKSANEKGDRPGDDPIFISVPLEHELYQKLMDEIKKKNLIPSGRVKGVAKRIQGDIEKFLFGEAQSIGVVKASQDGIVFKCGKFSRKLPEERIAALNRRASTAGLSENETVESITKMLMRYASILSRGQQWNIPRVWYEFAHKEYDADIEGFASPINSQLMLIDDDTQYCSLFPDTDAVFGSLGDIFTVDSSQFENHTIIMNPPYVEEIMDNTSDLIQEWIAEHPMRIIFNVVDWTDARYYKDSMSSKYLTYETQLAREEHAYESTNGHDVQRIRSAAPKFIMAKFPSHIFVFDSRPDVGDVGDYEKMKLHYGV